MWRVYLLRGYALAAGAGLLVLGVVGLMLTEPNTSFPENVAHVGIGLIYFSGGLVVGEFRILRSFVGGMGLLLVFGKVLILAGRSFDLGFFHFPFVGVVCLVVGVLALLIAVLVGVGAPSKS